MVPKPLELLGVDRARFVEVEAGVEVGVEAVVVTAAVHLVVGCVGCVGRGPLVLGGDINL